MTTMGFYRDMDALRREVERAFEQFTGDGGWRRPFSRTAFLPGLGARSYPLMNVSADEDHIYVEALAPGVDPDSLEIAVVQDTLRIAGEKKPLSESVKAEAFHRNERSAGKFVRTLGLGTAVDADKVTAEYKNGLLQITLPKAEAAKPKQISVQVG